jgi:hypothetical protein
MDARLLDSMQGQLSKLSNHEFMLYTKLRSKFKSTSGFAFEPAMDDVLIQLCRVQDGDEFLKSTPHIVWLPHLSQDFTNFRRFVTQNKLKRYIKSVVVHTSKEYDLRHVSTAQEPLERSVSEIWTQVFSCLEPTRVVVAAPPSTMAALLDSRVASNDTWAFEMKMHYLELLQKEPPSVENEDKETQRSDSALIFQRPWYHIGYNQGSSIAVYSTYEFQSKTAPRVFDITLNCLARRPESCHSLTSLTFISVFPLASSVLFIMNEIHRITSIKKVTFQLAPGPENDLLSNASKRRKAQSSDFWSEWRQGYHLLANMQTFVGRGKDDNRGATLTEIASRDCYTKQLTDEITEVVDYCLKVERAGWRSGGVGRWVRDTLEGVNVE